MTVEPTEVVVPYWKWFWKGSGGRPGVIRFWDSWLVAHTVVSLALVFVVPKPLEDAANTVLLPLTGLIVGLSFAWGGSAQALLQTSEISDLARHHRGGFTEYVYTYQTAILVILVTMVLWGAAGLGLFDHRWPTGYHSAYYGVIAWLLYFCASVSLRECWHVVLGAQLLLVTREAISRQTPKR